MHPPLLLQIIGDREKERQMAMGLSENVQFRVMTYNVGGARKDFGSNLAAILEVVKEISPDILVAQEVTDYQDTDGKWFSVADQIAKAGDFENNYSFYPTVTNERAYTRAEDHVRPCALQ